MDAAQQHESITWDEDWREHRRALFEATLRYHGGRETHGAVAAACRDLGVSNTTFLGVVPPPGREAKQRAS